MSNNYPIVDVIIPAFNEENSIGKVIDAIPKELVRHIVVGNNNSTDQTEAVAKAHGAIVVTQRRRGYGSACLKAMDWIHRLGPENAPDIAVFMDADFSDHPEELPQLIEPITRDGYDLVIGSRATGLAEPGALTLQQSFGNWLATKLIKWLYQYDFTDLGPFRAVRYKSLQALNMKDPDYGWTVEMQVKAAKMKLNCTEIPVKYRRRIGTSKVSGTVKGTILAGHKILWTIFKLL